jgi:putative tryptophan/tyrosine transport system substrate-binding protein
MTMLRRDFILGIGGAAAAFSSARSQPRDRERKIGVLIPYAEDDPQSRSRVNAFQQGLEKLGWTIGRNIRIDYRWNVSNAETAQAAMTDLLALGPDVLLASAPAALSAAERATHTIPIVFTAVSEPVEMGFAQSLAHPGGNITGFTNLEATVGRKWLELLKEIAPQVTHAVFMYNPDNSGSAAQFVDMAAAISGKLGVTTSSALIHTQPEIEPTIMALGRERSTGLIVPLEVFTVSYYKTITELATRYGVSAIYPLRQFVTAGGLMSYGPDVPDQFRRAASYVDRILKGEKPADLPVQNPTKYELVINLKVAKALGLDVSPNLLAIADEVIE